MKFLKKSLSLLLVLCMVLSFAPMNVFAAEETPEAEDTFYKIVHLDVARKYYSPEVIMDFIDDMAELGYNQLELYLGDNQGLRLMLNDTAFTANGTTYYLDQGIVNSGQVTDDPWVPGFFRPSQEYNHNEKYYLTEAEMDAIISYANSKGIEIVPAINMPGHMGAILMNQPESWRYTHTDGQVSVSTLNLNNAEAVAFTKALLQKYVEYFAGKGCKFFSIGADEFAYDIGLKGNVPADIRAKVVTFMNDCAGIITGAGMTPRAFNDFFEVGNGLTTDFEIYVWNGGNAIELQNAGYKIINTGDLYYYALGSSYYSSEKQSIVDTSTFDPMKIQVNQGTTTELTTAPAGAMVCIWSDRGYEGDDATADIASDGGVSVYEHSKDHIAGFAEALNGSEGDSGESYAGTYHLEVGGEALEIATLTGEYDNATVQSWIANTAIATATVQVTAAVPGSNPVSTTVTIPDGATESAPFLIKSGDNYLALDSANAMTAVTEHSAATQWKYNSSGQIVSTDGTAWLYYEGSLKVANWATGSWTYDGSNFYTEVQTAWWPEAVFSKMVISYSGSAWAAIADPGTAAASAYTTGTAATDATTKIKISPVAAGETTINIDGAIYQIIVSQPVTHPSITYPCATSGHSGGIATCTHGKYCVYCGEIYDTATDPNVHLNEVLTSSGTAKEPDAEGHYSAVATCNGCGESVGTASAESHYGGEATCVSGKNCASCGYLYDTTVDPENHTGGTELINVKSATLEEAGYTGDTACASCNVVLEKGVVIPKLESGNTVDITMYVGGTQTITLPNTTLTETVQEDDYVKFEVVNIPAKEAEGPTQLTSNMEVIAAEQIVVGDGTNFIKVENGALTTTTNIDEATQWTVERHDSGFELSCVVDGTKYYFTGSNEYGTAVRFVAEADANLGSNPGWMVGDNSLLTEFFYTSGQMLIGDGTVSTIGGSTGTAGTGNAYAYAYSPAVAASTEIRIEALAVTVGEDADGNATNTPSSLTAGDTIYRVTVIPDSTEGKSVVVELFQTNAQVTAPNGTTSYTITADMGGWNADTGLYDEVNSKIGIAIDEIGQERTGTEGNYTYEKDADTFPYYGTSSRGQDVAYGNGMVLDSVHHQEAWNNNTVADRSGDGVEFYYIRYWGGKWSFSEDRVNWVDMNDGDQIVAYYLQHTEVTNQNIVSTYVMDWGDMYDKYATSGESVDNWGVLDFAIKFEGGARNPELTDFIQPDKSAFYHNVPTWSVIGGVDLVQPETVTNADGSTTTVNKRRVRTIEGLETGEYEIYMITLTRTSDTATEQLPYNTPADVTTYSYDGTEYVVWLEDENTVYDTTSIVKDEAKYPITYGTDTWGNPSIDEVWIYEHQGVLLTYYVRAKHSEENLHVYYRVDDGTTTEGDPISGTPIYDYEIATSGSYFDNNFGVDSNDPTGLTGNTVVNVGGITETVTSVLTDMPAVPAGYRVGGYEFNEKILYGVETTDGEGNETVTYYTKENLPEGANIKHVVLYYEVKATNHYVPVDFGVPLVISDELFHFESLIDEETETVTVNSISLQKDQDAVNETLKYGEILYVNVEGSLDFSLRYTPNKVMQGAEDPVNFVINVTVKDKTTGDEKATKDVIHGVVFLPATTVYYEESFSTPVTVSNWNTTSPVMADEDPQDTQCYTKQNYNYGFDPYYQNYIDNSHESFTQTSINGEYRSFEFTGTGIELYANCNNNSGIAIVTILNADTKALVKAYIVDTRMVKGDNTATADQLDLYAYNVPIVSELGLDHGKYLVKIGSIKAGDASRNNQAIFFDGFRVYNTLQSNATVHETTAGAIYKANEENAPVYGQVRDAVLNSLTIDPDTLESVYAESISKNAMAQVYDQYGSTEAIYGLVISPSYAYTDTATEATDAVKLDMLDNGPKNEIYLWGGDSVTFSYDASLYDIQVGLKALNSYGIANHNYDVKVSASVLQNGVSVGSITVPTDTVTVTDEEGNVTDSYEVFKTSTDMYYPVVLNEGTTGIVTVTIQNAADDLGVLSVTRVKFVPKSENTNTGARTASVNDTSSANGLFQPLTEEALTAALISLGYSETPVEDIPGEDTADVEFVGSSLSLKGDIGLNFYYNLSEKILSDDSAYIEFTVKGVTQQIPVSAGVLDERDGSYRFSIKVNAKNMGDEVTAQFYTSEGAIGESNTLSVKAYADYVIANSSKESLVNLVKAMLNYGAAAQVKFNYNTDKLVNADMADADKALPETVDASAYASSLTGAEDGITVTSTSLLLQSETKIRIYFTLADGKSIADYTFTVDGKEVTPVASGSEYYIEKTNVAAKDLDTFYSFQLGGLTLNYCALSYVNQVQKYSTDANLLNLVKALYTYNQAANAYFG